MFEVPFSSDYDQRFITQLGGVKYKFDARWNERGQTWSTDLTRDADGVQLLAGAPMQVGQDILAPYALGIGAVILTDLAKSNTDAGPDDLGTRVVATWLSPDEVAIIKQILGPQGASIVASGAVPRLISGNPGSGSGTTTGGGITQVVNVTTTNTTFNVTGGLGFSQYPELSDASGNEVLIARFVQLPQLNPNPNIGLTAAILAHGEGTVRIYTGGTFAEAVGDIGAPTGSLRTSQVVTGADAPYELTSSPFANPNASLAVKVTVQAATPGTPIGVSFIGGVVS